MDLKDRIQAGRCQPCQDHVGKALFMNIDPEDPFEDQDTKDCVSGMDITGKLFGLFRDKDMQTEYSIEGEMLTFLKVLPFPNSLNSSYVYTGKVNSFFSIVSANKIITNFLNLQL